MTEKELELHDEQMLAVEETINVSTATVEIPSTEAVVGNVEVLRKNGEALSEVNFRRAMIFIEKAVVGSYTPNLGVYNAALFGQASEFMSEKYKDILKLRVYKLDIHSFVKVGSVFKPQLIDEDGDLHIWNSKLFCSKTMRTVKKWVKDTVFYILEVRSVEEVPKIGLVYITVDIGTIDKESDLRKAISKKPTLNKAAKKMARRQRMSLRDRQRKQEAEFN